MLFESRLKLFEPISKYSSIIDERQFKFRQNNRNRFCRSGIGCSVTAFRFLFCFEIHFHSNLPINPLKRNKLLSDHGHVWTCYETYFKSKSFSSFSFFLFTERSYLSTLILKTPNFFAKFGNVLGIKINATSTYKQILRWIRTCFKNP